MPPQNLVIKSWPNTALEATGHGVRLWADGGGYPVVRASAWALGVVFCFRKTISGILASMTPEEISDVNEIYTDCLTPRKI